MHQTIRISFIPLFLFLALVCARPALADRIDALDAAGVTAVASHVHGIEVADRAFDNDLVTQWSSYLHGSATAPEWLRISLPEVVTVDTFNLWSYDNPGWDGYYIDFDLYAGVGADLAYIGSGRLIDSPGLYTASFTVAALDIDTILYNVVGGTHWAHLREIEALETTGGGVVATPEPSTLLLLGAGLLALVVMGRRRLVRVRD